MYRYAFSCRSFRAAAATAASSASASASQRCRLYGPSPFRTAAASAASPVSQQWCRLYGSSSACPLRTATAAAPTAASSASRRCCLHDSSSVRAELWALPRPRMSAAAVIANRAKYGGAMTVAMRHVHCWCHPKLRGMVDDAGAATTAIKTRRGGDEQPRPASAGGNKAGVTMGAGSSKQTPLRKRLGITKKEAEKMRGDKRTTAPGYNNLVGSPNSCSADDGGGGGSSSSSSGEGLIMRTAYPSPSFVHFLLDRLYVTKCDAKQLVLEKPDVLTMSAAAADEVSRWLEDNLGMKRREVARLLLTYPEAGQLSVEDTVKPIMKWLRKTICPTKADVVTVLRQAPHILGQSIEGSLKPMMALLESKSGVSSGKVVNVAYLLLAIFVHSAENKRDPTLAWLSERLSSGRWSAMIDAAPKYRGMNIEKGVELNLARLRDCEGLKCEEVRRVNQGTTSIICNSSIKNTLEPRLTWMKKDLGLDKNEALIMLMRCPGIKAASLNRNLKFKIEWLKKTFTLTKEEAVSLAIRCPMLLVLSATKNLDPTIEFCRVEMGASDHELKRYLVQNLRFLMSSLEHRLRPRVIKMRLNSIEPRFSRHRYQISVLSDDKFEEFLRIEGTTS